jgi:NCS1 family nucleobase:cation symporter-1
MKTIARLTNHVRAVKNAGGAGSMFSETQPSTLNVGWGVMYGITAILGAWGSGTLGQSDWTRYANRPMAPSLAQLVAAPVAITITALIGIIVTSAAQNVLGQVVWNPIYLLADIQEYYGSSPRARAGVFFASIGMVSTQLAVRQIIQFVELNTDMAELN